MMAEQVGVFDQFTTVAPMFRGLPQWVSGDDQRRIAAYNIYEQIYWNVPEAFRLSRRGDDANPVYVPSGKQVVETLHRFLANDLAITLDPEFGSDAEQRDAHRWMTDLIRRERFYSRFTANKRYGIIRGDWLWHIYADPAKPEGSRISIVPVDPASYFPIYNEDNLDEIVGVHLVEPYEDENGDQFMRRLTYRKTSEEGGPSPISMEDKIFEVDAWGGPNMDEKTVRDLLAEEPGADEDGRITLPSPIDSLPVYHIQNFMEPQNPWGSSELRGMERLITAINQTVSDEELTLALEGLGVYTTDSGPPQDDQGEELPWVVAPGYVVELADGKTFNRVRGVDDITAFQDHLKYLHEQLDLGTGTPAIAKGDVEVTVAESGVAIALRMGPMLARVDEKENSVTDVMVNMLYDLRAWVQAYEPSAASAVEACRWLPTYGEKIPVNRKTLFEEIMRLADADPPIVSRKWVREQLAEIGLNMPADDQEIMNEILEEMAAFGQMNADIEGWRIDQEIGDNGQVTEEEADELQDELA